MIGAMVDIGANAAIGWLGVDNWIYGEYFDPLARSAFPITDDVEALVVEAALEEHSFFKVARASVHALELWVSQELVMTNAFSQIVLRAASELKNVHARAIMTEIAYGEHGRARRGFAKRAHPWLLDRLRESIDLPPGKVRPQKPTIDFMNRLASHITHPLDAVAYIGVGNERLIAPEYEGIRLCFQELIPEADFNPFLDANIHEDITHSQLCYELAELLITSSQERSQFIEAAKSSIKSRMTYFDELAILSSSTDHDS